MKYLNFLPLLMIAFVFGCSNDDAVEEQQSDDSFDRRAMLVNWADNIIVPSYALFDGDLQALESATNTFLDNPDSGSLAGLRNTWLGAYRGFQNVSIFEIGQAEILNYRNRLNVYPTNTQEIEGFIASGNWNFELPSTIDAQGFPAVDYLINGLGNDQEIIALYTTNPNAENYRNYLLDLVVTIRSLTTAVLSDWQNGFRDVYVNNTNSSASGSVDQTTNALMFYYEKALRAGKVGIPAGIFSSTPLPENVEAVYSPEVSKELLDKALTATQNFFNGKSVTQGGVEGPSLKTYLNFLNSIKNGSDLSGLINAQFDVAHDKVDGLSANFKNQIQIDNTKLLEAYDELQRNVVLMKVDMFQALSIDINYIDADGD